MVIGFWVYRRRRRRRPRHHKIPFEIFYIMNVCYAFQLLSQWESKWWSRVEHGACQIAPVESGAYPDLKYRSDSLWNLPGFFNKKFRDLPHSWILPGFLRQTPRYTQPEGETKMPDNHHQCMRYALNAISFMNEFPNIFHWITRSTLMAKNEEGGNFSILLSSQMPVNIYYTERERGGEKIDYIFRNACNVSYWENVKMNWTHFSCGFFSWIYLFSFHFCYSLSF